MANEKAKKIAEKKVEKAVWKAVKKGVTEGAFEEAVSQGMANGVKKKPVGKVALEADAKEAKTALDFYSTPTFCLYLRVRRELAQIAAFIENSISNRPLRPPN